MVSTRGQQRMVSGAPPHKCAKHNEGDEAVMQPASLPLLQLPVDVVFEVFKQTHPRDLLQLARTNKAIRKDLMSKSASGIWASARANSPKLYPPCPPDMSEPQWAVLFGPDCMICGKENAEFTDYDLRLRGCGPCLRKSCVPFGVVYTRCLPELRFRLRELVSRRMVPRSRSKKNAWASPNAGVLYYTLAIEEIGSKFLDLKYQIGA
ncbi:hypothetical protein FRB93_006870 [Tulasnella sp. JGI-2019a]|nr:hypothetical protein FRB93_006870 [Tulasnella sp. JGI-2019a]